MLWALTSLRVGQKLDELLQFHVSCLETWLRGFISALYMFGCLFWEDSGSGYSFRTYLDLKSDKVFLTRSWETWILIQIYLLTSYMTFSIVLLVICCCCCLTLNQLGCMWHKNKEIQICGSVTLKIKCTSRLLEVLDKAYVFKV